MRISIFQDISILVCKLNGLHPPFIVFHQLDSALKFCPIRLNDISVDVRVSLRGSACPCAVIKGFQQAYVLYHFLNFIFWNNRNRIIRLGRVVDSIVVAGIRTVSNKSFKFLACLRSHRAIMKVHFFALI